MAEPVRSASKRLPPMLGTWTPGRLALLERVPGDLRKAAAIGIHLKEVGILARPLVERCEKMIFVPSGDQAGS
jgi:hypothetical protein